MPRLVHKLPKYSRHKASGQARVRHGNKVTYLGAYGSPESHDAYARFVAGLTTPGTPPKVVELPPGVTMLVGEVILLYIDHAEKYYSRDGVPTGEHVTIRSALTPITARFAELPVTALSPKKLKQVREDMIRLGWTRYTINKAISIAKRCFNWAASEELIPADVAVSLTTVKGLQKDRSDAREKAPIGPVDDKCVEAVLPRVSELVANVLRLMRLTGMRPGEVLSMKAAEIDRTESSCWVYKPRHHKTSHKGKDRTIFLGPKAQTIILPRLLKAGANALLFPIRCDSLRWAVEKGCQRAFPHPILSKIPPKKRTDDQEAALEAWNKAHRWHPNQLRHSVGTEVRAKYGLEAAQVLLGHCKADITETYAERDMAKARAVARKIG
jgi:integrase